MFKVGKVVMVALVEIVVRVVIINGGENRQGCRSSWVAKLAKVAGC